MERRPLGVTGLTVGALGFGCGNVGGLMVRGDPTAQREAVARALDAGITYFDTAPQYGGGRSEENLGRVLHELDAWGRVVVGTKVRLTPEDRADPSAAVRGSVERSLRLLGRDAVDLLQLHNPLAMVADRDGGASIPPADVLGAVSQALRAAVTAGLVRHVGCTGLGEIAAIDAAVGAAAFETVQSYVNAVNPSAGFAGASGGAQDFAGLIGAAAERGMGVIAIRVMAAGALAAGGAIRPPLAGAPGAALVRGGGFEEDTARAEHLDPIVAAFGLESRAELSVRFALSVPGVSTVLVGYSDRAQLEDALRWAERGPLPDEAVQQVVQAAR